MKAIFNRRVVVDSSSRLTKLLANPTTHSHLNRQTFTSLYKPNQSRHFRTHYLPSSPSSPPVSRFDPSQLWRSEKIRGFFASALGNKAVKLGNLVESRVGFIGSQFPKKGFEFQRFSGFQRRGWYVIVPHSSSLIIPKFLTTSLRFDVGFTCVFFYLLTGSIGFKGYQIVTLFLG
jgi:hypothetical protein